MTAILRFKLPEERPEYDEAMQGGALAHAVREYAESLRHELKYGEPAEARRAVLEELRERLYKYLAEEGIEL